MLKDIIILGGGSAGLLAALTFKRKMPELNVRLLRSPDIGIIGVGESSTPNVPRHLFDYLGISRRKFYEVAEPTWKLGIHFLWGPRSSFEYTFEPQLDARSPELPRPNGYYCDDDFSNLNLSSALMSSQKAFARQPNGGLHMQENFAFHLENPKLVSVLELYSRDAGVVIIDGKLKAAERDGEMIMSLILEDGQRMSADFYVDSSGFRSELLGRTLEEPFISYNNSLFNDRAILGGWDRTDEPILPYTTAETMDSGWAWQIEHEHLINRGYVYSSSMLSDDHARAEFQAKNPKARIADRVVKFRTGRYRRCWVGNVMAIGNSSGFVEPLESTSLMVVCWQCQTAVEFLKFVGQTPTLRNLFNQTWANTWDEIRDFLALHFILNTRLDTPYWRACRVETNVDAIKPLLDFYKENGPTGFCRTFLKNSASQFGIEGFLTMLVGNQAPYSARHHATAAEQQLIATGRSRFHALAQNGLDVKQSLAMIRHPTWRWAGEPVV
jgi:tryptophan halogenase